MKYSELSSKMSFSFFIFERVLLILFNHFKRLNSIYLHVLPSFTCHSVPVVTPSGWHIPLKGKKVESGVPLQLKLL